MYTLTTITDSSVVRAPDNEFDFGGCNDTEGFGSKQQYRLKNNMIDYFMSKGVYKLHDEISL